MDEFSRLIDQELAAQGVGRCPPLPRRPQPLRRPLPLRRLKRRIPPNLQPLPQKLRPRKPPPNPPRRRSACFGSAPGGALSSFQTDGVTCSEAEAAKKQPTLINTSQLRELLTGKTKPLFVDVRPAKEFAAGRIPGAINIPVDDMPQRWSTLPKDRVIVFYESGQSSRRYLRLRPRGRKDPAGARLCLRSSQGVSGWPRRLGEIRTRPQQVNTQTITFISG